MNKQFLYRTEGKTYSKLSYSYGSESEDYEFFDKLETFSYEIISETPKGYWIDIGYKRFVLKSGKKRFAYSTKKEALEAFVIRKQFHIKHLKEQLAKAEMFLNRAQWQIEKELTAQQG